MVEFDKYQQKQIQISTDGETSYTPHWHIIVDLWWLFLKIHPCNLWFCYLVFAVLLFIICGFAIWYCGFGICYLWFCYLLFVILLFGICSFATSYLWFCYLVFVILLFGICVDLWWLFLKIYPWYLWFCYLVFVADTLSPSNLLAAHYTNIGENGLLMLYL